MKIARSVKDRIGILGGSDAPIIAGVSPFALRMQLWMEQTGRIERPNLDDVEAVRFGTLFEPILMNEFAHRTGKSVRRENLMTVHPQFDFLGGHIDRRVVGEAAAVEGKTTSDWAFKQYWGTPGTDAAPAYVLAQVHFYFALWPSFEKFYVPVLVGGQKMEIYEVPRDDTISTEIVAKCVEFWENYVLPDVPPPLEDDDLDHPGAIELLKKVYPHSDGSVRHLDPKIRPYVEMMIAEQEVRKQADAAIETCKARILKAMENSAVGIVEGFGEVHRKFIQRRAYTVDACQYLELRIKLPKEETA
ncbi:YqaJ viral recombinase family protein [Caballeronia sp. ATUFL_F1_KS39]|uniref:YqaJ viral recombinase family nuclease n=1 Tax=Caballeronia sp. ATUFL_F1_KS39 TaxID=2921766 RepID=UPI002029529D|nr:YqaJ viral recombinase family protein [Caballeronia sp. ATUFL_F1_KS39]